jgi:hypothetical protein
LVPSTLSLPISVVVSRRSSVCVTIVFSPFLGLLPGIQRTQRVEVP